MGEQLKVFSELSREERIALAADDPDIKTLYRLQGSLVDPNALSTRESVLLDAGPEILLDDIKRDYGLTTAETNEAFLLALGQLDDERHSYPLE